MNWSRSCRRSNMLDGWEVCSYAIIPSHSKHLYAWYILTFVISPFVTSIHRLYLETMGNMCAHVNLYRCCHISLSYIMGFGIKITHQSIQTTRSHALHWHHFHYEHCCIVMNFVLFHIVICYIDFLLSCMHVNIAELPNITCTLVATCVILGRLECTCRTTLFAYAYCGPYKQHNTKIVSMSVDTTTRNLVQCVSVELWHLIGDLFIEPSFVGFLSLACSKMSGLCAWLRHEI